MATPNVIKLRVISCSGDNFISTPAAQSGQILDPQNLVSKPFPLTVSVRSQRAIELDEERVSDNGHSEPAICSHPKSDTGATRLDENIDKNIIRFQQRLTAAVLELIEYPVQMPY